MINTDQIFLDEQFASKEEVFQFLADQAAALGIADASAPVLAALQQRESEGTTGMMDGFAIPHAKSGAIRTPSIMIATFEKGIDWDSLDGQPVLYAIALFIPDGEAGTTHLKVLSQVARMLMKQQFKEDFKAAKTPQELNELLMNNLDGSSL